MDSGRSTIWFYKLKNMFHIQQIKFGKKLTRFPIKIVWRFLFTRITFKMNAEVVRIRNFANKRLRQPVWILLEIKFWVTEHEIVLTSTAIEMKWRSVLIENGSMRTYVFPAPISNGRSKGELAWIEMFSMLFCAFIRKPCVRWMKEVERAKERESVKVS